MNGIIPAPYFFDVKEDSGEVRLKADLRTDTSFVYIVSLCVHVFYLIDFI